MISEQLRRELPGLRGFSANNLKNMRKFYENWGILDNNSTVTTVEIDGANSTIATVELQSPNNEIDINDAIHVPSIKDFPIEEFFKVPFTHHIKILETVSDNAARYYYITSDSRGIPDRRTTKGFRICFENLF
jgi:hypothetical protein